MGLKKQKKSILFSAAAIFLVLVCLELAIRLTGVSHEKYEDFYQDVYDVTFGLRPNAANPWSGIRETLNDLGFRGKNPGEKAAGCTRILCMGDSCTFGVGVEADQAYPARMEALLGDTCPDWCGDVVNAGIPGTSIYQQRLLFEKKLLPLRPDIVTVYSSPNWVDNIKDFRDASERQRWLRSAQRILRKSTLYSLLLKKIRGGPVERAHFEATRFETNLERYSMDEILADYEEDLDLLIRMSRKHDFKLLFVNFPLEQNIYGNRYSPPWYDSRHTPLIHLRAKAGDIVYLDLVGELRKHSDEVLFLDGVHPTPRGHQRIARALVDRMIESGLLAPASELPPK